MKVTERQNEVINALKTGPKDSSSFDGRVVRHLRARGIVKGKASLELTTKALREIEASAS